MQRYANRFCHFVLGTGMAFASLSTGINPAEAGELRLKRSSQQHSAGAVGGIGNLTAGFVLNCAPGFSLAGKKKGSPSTWTDWYVCSTPILTCPTQIQDNGLKSGVHPKVVVQTVGGDPDGGTVKFRVQYKCDYSYNALPEG